MRHARTRMGILSACCLFLAACGGDGSTKPLPAPPAAANLMDPAAFTIGPIALGRNASVGMPLHPSIDPAGWGFDLPAPPGHVDGIVVPIGSLAGKTSIELHYRLIKSDGARIVPTNYPANDVALITLFVQRKGDNWSCAGKYEPYRWYATRQTQTLDAAGDFVMAASLAGPDWTACQISTFANNPAGFGAAIAGVDNIAIVLGGGTGFGHGIAVVNGTARIVVTGFAVIP